MMTESITVELPSDIKLALDDLARREGVRPDEVACEAIRQHLFLQQFRSLRERMAARARSQGVVSDQDVFDRVS